MIAPTKERNHSNAQNVRRHKYGSLEEYVLCNVKKLELFKVWPRGPGGPFGPEEKHVKYT